MDELRSHWVEPFYLRLWSAPAKPASRERVGESVEDERRVRRIAELIGFGHVDELFAYFARTQALSGDAWWEARQQFPLSIPG